MLRHIKFKFKINILNSIKLHYFFTEEWQKINTGPVCFGARGDTYGPFHMVENGLIHTFKLAYRTGTLRCAPEFPESHWGCANPSFGENKMLTVITYPNKTALKIAEYTREVRSNGSKCRYYSYHLDGIDVNSTELAFNKLSSPMPVSIGQEFQIW